MTTVSRHCDLRPNEKSTCNWIVYQLKYIRLKEQLFSKGRHRAKYDIDLQIVNNSKENVLRILILGLTICFESI